MKSSCPNCTAPLFLLKCVTHIYSQRPKGKLVKRLTTVSLPKDYPMKFVVGSFYTFLSRCSFSSPCDQPRTSDPCMRRSADCICWDRYFNATQLYKHNPSACRINEQILIFLQHVGVFANSFTSDHGHSGFCFVKTNLFQILFNMKTFTLLLHVSCAENHQAVIFGFALVPSAG